MSMIEHVFAPEMMLEREKQLIIALSACAGAYYDFNVTKNQIVGTPIQIIDGQEYSIHEQIGLPPHCPYTDVVNYWGMKLEPEEQPAFFDFFDRNHLMKCYTNGEHHISYIYWTKDVLGNPMLAEQNILLYRDTTSGDLMGLTYVKDLKHIDELLKKEREVRILAEQAHAALKIKSNQLREALNEANILGELAKQLTANSIFVFDVDVTEGVIYNHVVGKTERNYKHLTDINIPCGFDEQVARYALVANTVFGDPQKKEKMSQEYLLSCFQQRQHLVERNYFLPERNEYHRITYYLYRDAISGHVFAYVVGQNTTKEEESRIAVQKLEDALKEAQLKNSLSQMQPHFLYNALASIREIVLEDPEYASDLIYDFSTHLRACIRTMSHNNLIPFSQELENIKSYVNIEKMRFGDKLRLQYEINSFEFQIVPLSIQPLVENAIRHGIYKRGNVGGTVTIRATSHTGYHLIEVIDDGVGFDYETLRRKVESHETDSTGLMNVIFRLEKMMNAKVSIDSAIGKGTNVTVRIPCIEKEETP